MSIGSLESDRRDRKGLEQTDQKAPGMTSARDDAHPVDGAPIESDEGRLLSVSPGAATRSVRRPDPHAFVSAFEAAADVVLVTDLQGVVVYVNAAGARLFGTSEEDAADRVATLSDVFEPVFPETVEQMLTSVRADGTWTGEARLLRRSNGEKLPVSASAFAVHGQDDDSAPVIALHSRASAAADQDSRLQSALDASVLRVAEQRAVAELSQLALRGHIDDLLSTATDAAAELLGARHAFVTRANHAPTTLETVAGSEPADPHHLTTPGPRSIVAYAARTASRIVWAGSAAEIRFDVSDLVEAGVRNAISVPIDGTGQPWGVLTVLDVAPKHLSPDRQPLSSISSLSASTPADADVSGVLAGSPVEEVVDPTASDVPMLDTFVLDTICDVLSAAVHRVGVEAELRYRSLRDPLTGLPNRALAYDRIESAMARAAGRASTTAVMLLDLDDFKSINDGLGHEAGDSALVALGHRLTRATRPGDTVARLGGDEFVAVCENVTDAAQSLAIARAYASAIRAPIVVASNELRITASIGVALTDSLVDGTEMIRRADVAMYRAKETGRGAVALFDTDDREHRRNQLTLSADLRSALDDRILTLAYQPIFDIATGRITSVEALARWRHPTLGPVSPETFVRIAERTGQINTLGLWALHTACKQAAEWQSISDIGVRVNVSALQLRQPDFVDSVARILAATGLPVGRLGLEITETVWLADTEQVRDALTELHSMGVSILLDDLGSGHSSVTYLSRYPVIEAFKIDQTYIQAMPGRRPEAIVSAIVSLAHAFDVAVVGEGVETQDQLDRLRDSGCDLAQGFLLAAPVSAEELTSMLLERRAG